MRWTIRHSTRFTYARPVALAPTTVRLRPRDDGTQRVVSYRLDVDPEPMARAFVLDAEGNACERLWFAAPAETLTIRAESQAETVRANPYEYVVNPDAATIPVTYTPPEANALARFRTHAEGSVAALARDVAKQAGEGTADFLRDLATTISRRVELIVREDGEAFPAAE
ncbi:MAG: transglutaminase N-terminal domain-containing protein, partial [Actinomycetota bacterium]